MDGDVPMSAVSGSEETQQGAAGSVEKNVKKNWDHLYHVDAEALDKIRKSKPWAAGSGSVHPKYFSRVFCSASATVKMVSWRWIELYQIIFALSFISFAA